jgi:hypothetical protein
VAAEIIEVSFGKTRILARGGPVEGALRGSGCDVFVGEAAAILGGEGELLDGGWLIGQA